MKKIAVVTATRAEYGILRPLLYKLLEHPEVEMQLLVTGTHLSKKYGYTQDEIEKDHMPIFRRIPILEDGNTAFDISITMANALSRFALYFADELPDLVVLLGDRTEMLGIAAAAMNMQIPIAHLHGGELTEGAVDDCVRHALTKMSYLHFASTEVYRKRILQLGEQPDRVFNVGALGVENILNLPLLNYRSLCEEVGIPVGKKYVVVTFHPVTMEQGSEIRQVNELLHAMECRNDLFYLITKANADAGGENINHILEKFAESNDNIKLVSSLGVLRYLSAVKYAEFVLGNSSSGIIEAPSLGTPTVNIGERQQGRVFADTIICCDVAWKAITKAMEIAESIPHEPSYLYGHGNTSEVIVEKILQFLNCNRDSLKKKFFDMTNEV